VLQPSGRPQRRTAGIRAPAFSKVCGHLGKLSHRLGALFDNSTNDCRKIPIARFDLTASAVRDADASARKGQFRLHPAAESS
jgi:hypothetical protein